MKEIIVYTTSTCPHCVTAKNMLQQKGYAYVEKNVQMDTAARSEMAALGLMGVPSFKVGDVAFSGLDIDRLEGLLDYKVVACPKCSHRTRVPKGKGKIKVTCKSCNEAFILTT